jgi:hypothetical protein
MSARMAATLLGVLALAHTAGEGAPARDPQYYFPTSVGTERVYQENDDKIWSDVVSAVEWKDGARIVSVVDKRHEEMNLKVAVSANGLFRVECRGHKDNPPVCWLMLPAEQGCKWTPWANRPNGLNEFAEVIGFEDIEVPAGRFHTIVVRHTISFSVQPEWSYTRWYALGVGLVKQESHNLIEVLKSISPRPK